jgi:hypothetical protein
MRKQETIIISGIEVTVSEVSVTQIYRLLQGETSIMNLPLPEAMHQVKGLLPLALNVDLEQLLAAEIYSGDIDLLVEAFKRTNPVFFKMASALKLDSVLASVLQSALTNFSEVFANSLPQGTASEPGSMASAFSMTA